MSIYKQIEQELKNIRNKGTSLLEFVDEYIVVDVETTGLDTKYCDIIEIAAIKVKNGQVVDVFQSLINPNCELPAFITALTGISNDMIIDAPCANEVLQNFFNFIEDGILVGHNVHFDINFIYDISKKTINKELTNDFVDTLRWSRILVKDTKVHKLGHLATHLKLNNIPSHRAMSDCLATYELYELLRRKRKND